MGRNEGGGEGEDEDVHVDRESELLVARIFFVVLVSLTDAFRRCRTVLCVDKGGQKCLPFAQVPPP